MTRVVNATIAEGAGYVDFQYNTQLPVAQTVAAVAKTAGEYAAQVLKALPGTKVVGTALESAYIGIDKFGEEKTWQSGAGAALTGVLGNVAFSWAGEIGGAKVGGKTGGQLAQNLTQVAIEGIGGAISDYAAQLAAGRRPTADERKAIIQRAAAATMFNVVTTFGSSRVKGSEEVKVAVEEALNYFIGEKVIGGSISAD